MEDSIKGLLITLTVIGLFITCILNFIVLFPTEQGVTFSGKGQNSYLQMAKNNDTQVIDNLDTVRNQSQNAFDQWDITQGYMGSNQLKQSQGGIGSMITKTFNTLETIGTELFTKNSPIVYAILIFSSLASGVLIYVIIRFIRTGQ